VLRPPLAGDRLRRLADGRVRVELKRAWRDRTTPLLFEPVEFLEKRAALTPRPEIKLALYPRRAGAARALAARRRRLSPDRRRPSDGAERINGEGRGGTPGRGQAPLLDVGGADAPGLRPGRPALSALRPTDAADGRDRSPVVIQRILAHLGLPGARAGPPSPSSGAAARAEPPALPDRTLSQSRRRRKKIHTKLAYDIGGTMEPILHTIYRLGIESFTFEAAGGERRWIRDWPMM
jgi:Putative transposase